MRLPTSNEPIRTKIGELKPHTFVAAKCGAAAANIDVCGREGVIFCIKFSFASSKMTTVVMMMTRIQTIMTTITTGQIAQSIYQSVIPSFLLQEQQLSEV